MMRRLVTADAIVLASGVAGNAVLVEGSRVSAIGEVAELRSPEVPEDRYPGCIIVPGLRDAHIHPLGFAATISGLDLTGTVDLDDLGKRLASYAATLPEDQPVIGSRFDDEATAEGRMPSRGDLDRLLPGDRGVLIYRVCGHIASASTSVLERAGVGSATTDPVGGRLVRDETGAPTGVLEETAVTLVSSQIGGRTSTLTPEEALAGLRRLADFGLTSVGAIIGLGTALWCAVGDELDTLIEVAPDSPIKLNVLLHGGTPAELEAGIARLGMAGTRIRFLGLKEFSDGSLGGHTAALRSPYADQPDNAGTMRIDPKALNPLASIAIEAGGMIALHAIGDLAADRAMDYFESQLERGVAPERLRMEHVSILDEAAVERFASLGITASIQPSFAVSDAGWIENRLGRHRAASAYPYDALRAAGVPMAGGSDAPVEIPDPLRGMADARDPRHSPARIADALAVLKMYTEGAAAALGEPEPLALGSPADFTILDMSPLDATVGELRSTRVLGTWLDGEPV